MKFRKRLTKFKITKALPKKFNRGFKALLQLANFTLGPDATLNTEIHKNSSMIKLFSLRRFLKKEILKKQNKKNNKNKRKTTSNNFPT